MTNANILHAPAGTGMLYLPSTGNSDIDNPSGARAADSVQSLDSRLGNINTATVNADPAAVRSFCDHTCGGGCTDSLTKMPALHHETLTTSLDALIEGIEGVKGVITNQLSGTWGERLQTKYGSGGEADLSVLVERTEAVKAALPPVITSSNKHADGALKTVRESVKSVRMYLAGAAEKHKADTGIGLGIGSTAAAAIPGLGMIAAPVTALLGWLSGDRSVHDGGGAPSIAELSADGAESDKSIGVLDAALADWKLGAGKDADSLGNQLAGNAGTGSGFSEAPDEVITDPGVGSLGGGGDIENPDTSLAEKLDELLGREPDARPDMGLPTDGLGGGMPGGGMPGSMGMPDLGQGMQSPFGQEQPFAAVEEPLDDEPEDTPADDRDTDKDENTDVDEAPDDELLPDDTQPDDGGVAPIDAGVPAAHAEFDPNSEEARTVDVGNGRMATMPSFRMAETLRAMVAADQFNPKSLFMAASESGYVLPPQGEDLGEPVSPASMREGDVITADGKHGIYLGDGDVLMEDKSVQKLGDVAGGFNREHDGIFRLAEPDTAVGAHGPVQQVGAVQEAPPVAAAPAEVGVPTDDAPVVGSTSESTANVPGLSMSAAALDPNAAFSS
ncbi:hypothetical protein [Mycolicibacter icosiumassiliensis]|uniref:hypothetical protein n=1 Tax=Mycolicibacter icosiumassiliensis TaxID=1792835 RepID=UPI0008368B82|nr:hypothetical protein [Mycolicibacter icosiumassiliensis]